MNEQYQSNPPSLRSSGSRRAVRYAARATVILILLLVAWLVVSVVGDWSGLIGLALLLPFFALMVLHVGVGLYSVVAVLLDGIRPGNVWLLIYYLITGSLILWYVAWIQDWSGHVSTKIDRMRDPHTYALSGALRRNPPDLDAAIEALEAGANPEGTGRTSRVPLRRAARIGEAAIVRKLLEYGADVNAQWSDGGTALHEAAGGVPQWGTRTSGSAAVVEELIAAGANVNATTNWGWTPLLAACAAGSEPVAQRLVDAGADIQAQLRNTDKGCLAIALEQGHDELMQWRLSLAGAPSDLSIALAMVFDRADVEWFRRLLALGAPVDGLVSRHRSRKYPFFRFLRFERPEDPALFEALLGKSTTGVVPVGKQHSWLVHLTRDEPQVLGRLLLLGVDVDAKGLNGETALHALVRDQGSLHLSAGASMLIAAGASIDARARRGWTPLMEAALLGYAEDVRWLLENGADATLQDNSGRTIWELALGDWHHPGPHTSVFQTLVAADLALPNTAEQIALLRQAVPDPDAVSTLIEGGFAVSVSQTDGEPPTHAAVRANVPASLQALLEAGAPPDHFDANGYSLTTLAAAKGADAVLAWLLDTGFDAEAVDQRGRSPMRAAIPERQLASIRVLLEAGVIPGMGDRAGIRRLLERPPYSDKQKAEHEAVRALLNRSNP